MFKRFRIRLGISQTRFAKLLGLPRTTYQCYEYGSRKPSPEKEKEIRRKIKEIERRLNKLDKHTDNYLIYLLDLLMLLGVLYLIWGI